MSAFYTRRLATLARALLVAGLGAGGGAGAVVACGSGDLVVGDDSRDASQPALPDAALPDTAPPGPNDMDSSTTDAATDAAGDGSPANCPELVQPAPGFCDGGPYAPLYDSKACIVGFACTPVSCTSAGGTCVGLAPGTCPGNKFGDANKYSCGGGLGVACCLP